MRNKKLLYISGPMSNLPNWNYPMFDYWEKYWKSRGYKVINPAKQFFRITWLPWTVYIIYDILILQIRNVTHLFIMKGFESSTGACIEILVANRKGIKLISEDCKLDEFYEPNDCQ